MLSVTGMLSAVGNEVAAVLDEIVDEFTGVVNDGSTTDPSAHSQCPDDAAPSPPPDGPPSWQKPQQYRFFSAGSPATPTAASSRDECRSAAGSAAVGEPGPGGRPAAAPPGAGVGSCLRAPGRVRRAPAADRHRHRRGGSRGCPLRNSGCSAEDNLSSLCEWSSDVDRASAELCSTQNQHRPFDAAPHCPSAAAKPQWAVSDTASVSASAYDEAEDMGFDVVRGRDVTAALRPLRRM